MSGLIRMLKWAASANIFPTGSLKPRGFDDGTLQRNKNNNKKKKKYSERKISKMLTHSHLGVPVAAETMGATNKDRIDSEMRITRIRDCHREGAFLF